MATTTPNYGWPVPTSTDYVKDGAVAIEALGDAIDATVFGLGTSGLTLVKSQVIGTTVSSVAVTSAFSTTYDAYKIVIAGGVASAACDLTLSLTGGTSSYSFNLMYTSFSSTAFAAIVGSAAANFGNAGGGTTNILQMNCEVINPFLTKHTIFNAPYVGDTVAGIGNAVHKSATSFTGFTIGTSAGTLTGGTIYVYGYKK